MLPLLGNETPSHLRGPSEHRGAHAFEGEAQLPTELSLLHVSEAPLLDDVGPPRSAEAMLRRAHAQWSLRVPISATISILAFCQLCLFVVS